MEERNLIILLGYVTLGNRSFILKAVAREEDITTGVKTAGASDRVQGLMTRKAGEIHINLRYYLSLYG